MAKATEFLALKWETSIEFLAPGSGPAQSSPGHGEHLWSKPGDRNSLTSFSNQNKQTNKKTTKNKQKILHSLPFIQFQICTRHIFPHLGAEKTIIKELKINYHKCTITENNIKKKKWNNITKLCYPCEQVNNKYRKGKKETKKKRLPLNILNYFRY